MELSLLLLVTVATTLCGVSNVVSRNVTVIMQWYILMLCHTLQEYYSFHHSLVRETRKGILKIIMTVVITL